MSMPILSPPPDSLFDGAALFLDFDGTLIELAQTPDAILVPEGLAPLLKRLGERLGGRVAIVSGRALDDLERFLPTVDLVFCGSHGLERRSADGERVPLDPPPQLEKVRAEILAFADRRPGLLIENKPAGVAVHYRLAPAQADAVNDLAERLARREGLSVQRGNMVAELRAPGVTKGDAVKQIMEAPPFRGARPLFLGDDLTDEHAFEAAAALGGAGVLVGAERKTAARYRLPSVHAVAEWLERAA